MYIFFLLIQYNTTCYCYVLALLILVFLHHALHTLVTNENVTKPFYLNGKVFFKRIVYMGILSVPVTTNRASP